MDPSTGTTCSNRKGLSRADDLVRREYKRYKQKKPLPNFDEVIDFTKANNFSEKVFLRYLQSENVRISADSWDHLGLRCPSTWKIYEMKSCPGFLFIVNPFKNGSHWYWSKQAVTEYTRKPYPSNLDVHMELDPEKTVWDISLNDDNPERFMEKLRWFHLGYHFDYNYVNYKQKNYYGFPADLAKLMKSVAVALGFASYIPETAIVNYYPIGSSMGGHTDHYEEDLDQPLVSVSFGQPAVFLIGGPTRDIKPEAIWIRSGDMLLMSGTSRVAFHAVPCIVKEDDTVEKFFQPCKGCQCQTLDLNRTITNSINGCSDPKGNESTQLEDYPKILTERQTLNVTPCKVCLQCGMYVSDPCFDNDEAVKFKTYMSRTRININVRQVHRYTENVN